MLEVCVVLDEVQKELELALKLAKTLHRHLTEAQAAYTPIVVQSSKESANLTRVELILAQVEN